MTVTIYFVDVPFEKTGRARDLKFCMVVQKYVI